MITDEQIQAACEGDEEAAALLTEWLYDVMTPYVRKRIPDQDQEDIHHRALQAIIRKMGAEGPREREAFRMWALGFARTLVKEHWRIHGRDLERYEHELDVEFEPAPNTSAPERLHKSYLLSLLSSFLRRLPQKYRSPLLHYFRDGRDTSFAEKHNIAKATVRWRRHEGRNRLRAMFRSRFGLASDESMWELAPSPSPRP